jgi:hypothetical protein
MNMKAFGRKQSLPNQGTVPEFTLRTEENNEEPQSRQPVSKSRFEPNIPQIHA